MLKIRRSCDRLIFNMGIPIPGKGGLYIETWPRWSPNYNEIAYTWKDGLYIETGAWVPVPVPAQSCHVN